jgi:hypothetical protein
MIALLACGGSAGPGARPADYARRFPLPGQARPTTAEAGVDATSRLTPVGTARSLAVGIRADMPHHFNDERKLDVVERFIPLADKAGLPMTTSRWRS